MEGYFAQGSNRQKIKKTAFAVLGLLAVIGVVATITVVSSSSVSPVLTQFAIEEQEFRDFMDAHGKSYSSEEEYQMRFKIFRDNSAYIRIFNSLGNSWALGINKFADISFPEFKAKYLSYKLPSKESTNVVILDEAAIPSSIDWTTKGAVTPVKNQGVCVSGWTFAATGAVEGAWFISRKTLLSLSEQELVDCSTNYGNSGCNGGVVDFAFKFIVAYGITTETTYPYTAKDSICNKYLVSLVKVTISKYVDVAKDSLTQLYAAVAQQPIAVAVEADQSAWQLYKGGIVDKDCGTNLDHNVLIVGYDQSKSPHYWKVKNSWGPDWGEKGYIRIAAKKGTGICGINMQPSYPAV